MKFYKRIVSLFLVIAMAFSLSVSSFAVESSSVAHGSYWDFYGMNTARNSDAFGPWAFVLRKLGSFISKEVCPNSPDYLHHGEITQVLGVGRGGSVTAKCTCDYCTVDFTVDVTADKLNTAYADYVESLPATGYASDGSLLWLCPYSSASLKLYNIGDLVSSQYSPAAATANIGSPVFNMVWSDSTGSFSGTTISGGSVEPYFQFAFEGAAPISGSYKLISNSIPVSYATSLQSNLSTSIPCNAETSDKVYSAGESVRSSAKFLLKCKIISAGCAGLYYRVVPHVSQSATYPADTRTGSLSGNFGYTGDNGQMITAEDIHIVNETDNSVFNPVTNTTTKFNDWTFDYSTRTYTVTLDSGTKQTITYGDEHVTIIEGDTVYNVYYMVPGGEACVHKYAPAVTTAETCIAPGVKALPARCVSIRIRKKSRLLAIVGLSRKRLPPPTMKTARW